MIRAGDLRHKITIQSLEVGAPDTIGQAYAAIEPIDPTNLSLDRNYGAEVSHRIRMRYMAGIGPTCQILFGTRVFYVVQPVNVDERNIELRIFCTEAIVEPVTYTRGDSSVDVNATAGITASDIDRSQGGIIESESRDFIIAANQLKIGSEYITPKGGDQISKLDQIFQVMHEPVWEWSDSYRIRYVIHTRLISTAGQS